MYQESSLQMEWCLDCHGDRRATFDRERTLHDGLSCDGDRNSVGRDFRLR